MKKNKVFLDSSILITALLSYKGGSFYILTNFRDRYEFQINKYVLEETIDVLEKKFSNKDLKSKLFLFLGWVPIKILPNPKKGEVKKIEKIINKEDAPILASAIKHSHYLLTLDKDFFIEPVEDFSKKESLAILKPKEFIERHHLN